MHTYEQAIATQWVNAGVGLWPRHLPRSLKQMSRFERLDAPGSSTSGLDSVSDPEALLLRLVCQLAKHLQAPLYCLNAESPVGCMPYGCCVCSVVSKRVEYQEESPVVGLPTTMAMHQMRHAAAYALN